MIISPNAKRDYVVPHSPLASQVPGNSIIRVLCKRSGFDYLIRNYCQAKMWVRRRCKLLKKLTIYSTVTPGVAGSSPVRSAISCVSVPTTWVTDYSRDMGNTLASKGLGAHSKCELSWSKNPKS